MNIDAELDLWRQQWQAEATVPLDLRRMVERQSRWMKFALAADILVTIVIGGGAVGWALQEPRADIVQLAVATWIFLAAAWTFSLTVNRGNWSPSALDTAAFLDLSVRRCRGRLAAMRFGAVLFVTQLIFCLGWVYHHDHPREPLWRWLIFSSLPIDIVWLLSLAFFVFLFWYSRKKRAELAYLLDVRGQMTER